MKIDVYQSANSGSKYLSVPSGTDVTKLQLPADTDPDLLSLSPFRTEIELDPSQPRIALDQKDIESQIADKGFAVHGVKTTITVGGNGT